MKRRPSSVSRGWLRRVAVQRRYKRKMWSVVAEHMEWSAETNATLPGRTQ